MCTGTAFEVSGSTCSLFFALHTHIPGVLTLLIPHRHPSHGWQ
ncbi:hypothetical protein E2C01_100837 [Portunus trituberculatus]|uniref:Uncharacterized protein n=1 Tax=Portunus trituberculatus TaxID=210409 RepID=A0A5B7KD81_PORTR|nr:hypothetical protein [Portunus trituberculatus]